MNMPVRHRPGGLLERAFPAIGWGEPMAAELDELYERMTHLLESAAPSAGAWAPLADMHETDTAYVIEAELPGIKREDIDVEINEREMRITGEYRQCEREGVLRRSTRRTGHFEYRALLPTDVNTEGIEAVLADGLLTVAIPKAQATKPRHIEISQPGKAGA